LARARGKFFVLFFTLVGKLEALDRGLSLMNKRQRKCQHA
jgi:hypothetical protein